LQSPGLLLQLAALREQQLAVLGVVPLKSQNSTHCLNAQQWHSAATDKSNARLIVRLRVEQRKRPAS